MHWVSIFVFVLCNNYLIESSICMKKATDCFKPNNENNKVPIKDTSSQVYARAIYRDHGVGPKRLCRSIDGKTTRILGYPICKRAIERMNYVDFNLEEVWCEEVKVESIYKHAKEKKNADKATKNKKNQESDENDGNKWKKKYHTMVKCGYKMTERGGGRLYVYVMHAKDNFFYLFTQFVTQYMTSAWDNKADASLEACYEIKPRGNEFPKIEVKATKDAQTADTIFGIKGVGDFKDRKTEGHVCYKTNDKYVIGNFACNTALANFELSITDVPVDCNSRKIKRFEVKTCENCPKESKEKYDVLSCTYTKRQGAMPKSLMLINTPEYEYFYVAKPDDDDKFWYIAGIIHVSSLPQIEAKNVNKKKNKA